ncbi:methyl-accepting chemotaxis protein [Arhodomonas aquaeolei]|uniref:methyl-accepting chemotaxis protein n=1 Tax=Arhodomonas aquaeolei TaxID=2369 RepID=UPI0004775F1D|nr:methyl-accepting chemotaxis protein [Arhodomonas aquaeolei]
MAREDNRQASTGLRRVADLLTVVAALAIVAMVAAFALVAHYRDIDRAYISRAEGVRLQSQKIAKDALKAANGKSGELAELKSGREALQANIDDLVQGAEAAGLPPTAQTSDAAVAALDKVVRVWQQMREEVNAILDRKEMLARANAVAERFRVLLPQIQENAAGLADALATGGGSARQVALAAELNTLAGRMRRDLSGMVRGGSGGNTPAAPGLEEAADRFGRILQGLSQGSEALGVSAVTGEQARSRVSAIASDFEQVRSSIDQLVSQSPELFRVRDAAEKIYTLSERLLATGQQLTVAYRGLSGSRWVQPWMAYALAALALVVLIARALVAWQISRQVVARAEAERAEVKEANERNQQAILNLLDEIEDLKEGDLTVEASVGEEMTGAIADAFNDATDALRRLVTTINDTSVQVSTAAQQTQATAMHLAEASDHQAHQITSASAAISQMAVSVDQVSQNAEESARVAQQSVELATRGAETVNRTIEQMDTTREQIQETSKRIKRLGESSQEIGNIVELINDIADQTNILALNASIQAAMAGESGRGFAVVADEVQRLAERSGNATKQIEALVKTIQTDTNEAVISMEQSTAGVVAGARQAEEAGDALREIENVSEQLAGLIQSISEASRQQAHAAANVSDTMNVIQEITSQTSAGTNETATSIGNLADLANELRESVAGFNLPEENRTQ